MTMPWADVDLLLAEADDGDALVAALASIENDEVAVETELMSWIDVGTDAIKVDSTTEDDATSSVHDGDEDDKGVNKGGKKKRKWRNTPKEELLRLRETVKELETELSKMKHDEGDTMSMVVTTSNMWRRIAARQLTEREAAVRENARLRSLLDEHFRTAKSLERLLLKRQNDSEDLEWLPEKRARIKVGANLFYDSDVEAQMRQTVLDMYKEVDRIVADPRFQTESQVLPVTTTDLGVDSPGQPQIEVLEANLLPFDLEITAETLWTMWMHGSYGPVKISHVHDLDVTENETLRTYEGMYATAVNKTRFVAKTVGRRFVEVDRVVMTAIVLMQPLDLEGNLADGVYSRAKVWYALYRTKDAQGNPTTRRLGYRMTSPDVFGSQDQGTERDLQALKKFMLGNETPKAELVNQTLENLLVEQLTSLNMK
ncbi:hypothetical protein Poli38472_001374 [Pythium oligandrum]|uniref:Uncharacterized protein n=1 Tax=Pythium oligandrum TaxID=41045 RepID=A0A8K1CVW8_PYTOL|nr:hypothetical protein Poli38472_001374 [Pythium oligandrum]|eukprot:TMW69218.1 hypothetical protein Poli38472_001374 [Pythium oligandrum]